ncbi:uncharacterized protein LOC123530186 isoform X2 [Mercenaria mercenaria]|uniref:uncharacterized protein LOC123530186 isoform X2 n=1 Tax=Mercenaria mercenaria TaxID=6596 RepID=UPI00234E5951|nr:uncharacterized protein LOC123530186 isoform X2 [Mercenaria mercenaria]
MKYFEIAVFVLAFVLYTTNGNSPCFDVDTAACKLMEHNKPDLCDSSIGETACPRYCGKCPLECFSCPDTVQDISQCNKVVTCDFNQTCYTMEIFDFDRSHGISGGCVAKELCVPHSGQAQLFGRSSSTVQTRCCDSDRCNGPSPTTTTSTTSTTARHRTHAHSGHHTTASHCVDRLHSFCSHLDCSHSHFAAIECKKTCGLCFLTTVAFAHVSLADYACSDLNTDACKLMHHDKPDLCDSSTGETACPRYCGKCPLECYTSSDLVQDLSQSNALTCDVDQVCYSMEVTDFDQSHGFRGGCINKEVCVPHALTPQIFGRSSSAVHINCCDTDRCNGPSTTAAVITSPTTQKQAVVTTADNPHCKDHSSSCPSDGHCNPHYVLRCPKSCGRC